MDFEIEQEMYIDPQIAEIKKRQEIKQKKKEGKAVKGSFMERSQTQRMCHSCGMDAVICNKISQDNAYGWVYRFRTMVSLFNSIQNRQRSSLGGAGIEYSGVYCLSV